ncbi:MAG: hypothetical protein Q9217_000205 [Psora testacea]
MNSLVCVFSQYELLERTANYLSTIDLYNTALTCSDLFALIRQSERTFTRLKRVALCDGSGLRARQNYEGFYNGLQGRGSWHWKNSDWAGGRCLAVEEIEIRVWRRKCDGVHALPCIKCGINVCEECRYVPRVRTGDAYNPSRRPHYNTTYQNDNMICYCDDCDEPFEAQTEGKFCDCDRYTRWICLRCRVNEQKELVSYMKHHTQFYGGGDEDEAYSGMILSDHQHQRMVSPPEQPTICIHIYTSAEPHIFSTGARAAKGRR